MMFSSCTVRIVGACFGSSERELRLQSKITGDESSSPEGVRWVGHGSRRTPSYASLLDGPVGAHSSPSPCYAMPSPVPHTAPSSWMRTKRHVNNCRKKSGVKGCSQEHAARTVLYSMWGGKISNTFRCEGEYTVRNVQLIVKKIMRWASVCMALGSMMAGQSRAERGGAGQQGGRPVAASSSSPCP